MITSSLPGGPADKGGTNYEILWGLHAMLDLVQERAESIRIEPPGVDGAEFYILREGVREHWQTKRQVTGQENWSLQKLKSEGVLDFFLACAGAGERAFFASISDAPELRMLSTHAQNAKDFAEFTGPFLTKPRRKEFDDLRKHLGSISEEDAFAFLLKVHVVSADEGALEDRFLHPLLTALFTGPAVSAQANLSSLYLNNVHQTLTRAQILDDLEKAGIRLREVASSPTVRSQLRSVTDEYIAGQRAKLISGSLVPRKVAGEVVQTIRGAITSLDLLISSSAGGGKSACLYQITSELTAAGVPVLAFRLDRLDPTVSTDALGDQMGLIKSPALVLARAYPRQPVVLVIDQLDFVSTTSGRNPDFFDTLAALVEEVRGLRATQVVHLVLACRQFDLENDHRFRRLLPKDEKPINLGPLTPDEVKAVIKATGGNPDRLQPRQLELLGLAQNLALFVDSKLVLQDRPSFLTQKDLFDAYWNVKKEQAENAHPSHAAYWSPLLRTLTEEMSRRQELSVPQSILDGHPRTLVNHLVSSGVLTFNGRVYGFGHESFFDYCFARGAVARPEEVAAFLETDDQLLFRRAQLRQVLVYLREDDPKRYLLNLRLILRSSNIRPHLKLLALELVAIVPDPTEEEFACLRPFLDSELPHRQAQTENPDKMASRAWVIFLSSRTLFPLVDRLGFVSPWLSSTDGRLNDLAVHYLRWQLDPHADLVAKLVEPFETRPEWHPRLRALVERGDFEKGRRYFDLVLRLLERGVLDEAKAPFYSSGGFWTTVSGLAEAQPTWAAELAARWLDRQVARACAVADGASFGVRLDDDSGVDDLAEMAKNAPTAVLEQVLPAVLRAVEALPYDFKTEGLPWDRAWSGHYRSDDMGLSEAYLQACKTAFAAISADAPEALRPHIQDLVTREFDTANQLLFAVYQCHPRHFADEALTLIASDSRRLYSALFSSSYWLAHELIEACSPHCSEEVFRKIEAAVVSFVPEDERTGDGYKHRGHAAFTLASALDASRIRDTTKTKLIEWAGKLGEPYGPPDVISSYSVISPINEESASHMTDDQWLRAMGKYHAGHPRGRGSYLRGGAAELAGMLGAFVTKEPKRFAALAHRFPANAEPNYLCAVLRNLKDADIPGDEKVAVARFVFSRPTAYAASSALDLLGSIKDVRLPIDAVEYVRRMAFHGPGPSEKTRRRAAPDDKDKERDIRIEGLNTVHGQAIEAITQLVLQGSAYLEDFGTDIESLAIDPSAAIRGCAASAVYAMATHDSARALALLPAFFDSDAALHGSNFVCRLIRHSVGKHLEILRPYVHRLLESPNATARLQGGIAACLARLHHPEEDQLAEAAMAGPVEARRGVAIVAEGNLLDPKCRGWCEQALRRLFDDPDREVRNAAAHCFWQLWQKPDHPLADYADLIEAFLKSAAFTTDPSFLLHALEDTKTRLPEQVLHVCEIFVGRCAAEARDIRTSIAADESTVGKLVFRAIAQLSDRDGQRRAVAVVDRMCLEGMHSAGKHLGEIER